MITGIKITGGQVTVGLLVLVFLVGGGNLWATHDEVQAQATQQKQEQAAQQKQQRQEQAAAQRAGILVEAKICDDVGTMAKIAAPSGAASSNPSRAYEQAEHRAWAGLYAGLKCNKIGGAG